MNGKQKALVNEFEDRSGFEFLCKDDVERGNMTFREAWNTNIRWLENLVAEISNLDTRGALNVE